MSSLAIDVRDLHKVYRRYGRRKNFGTLKSALLGGRVAADLRPDATFEALGGVSFQVQAGRTVGIIGRNGSGKTTLQQIIWGTLSLASGNVELSSHFWPCWTGLSGGFILSFDFDLNRARCPCGL